MSDIETLDVEDVDDTASLLREAFDEDTAYRFVFRTSGSRQRWLKKIFTATARIGTGYGHATGIRMDRPNKLAAIGLWFPPQRRFPPPFYRTLIPSLPMLPIVFELATYYRYYRIYQLTISLLPRHERFLYLAGLAVSVDCR